MMIVDHSNIKSLIWSTIIDWYKKFRKNIGPKKKLFAFSNLKKIFTDSTWIY